MFNGATSANPDTTNWDTSKVTTMYAMFLGASSANPNTTNWDTSQVTNMGHMFRGATSANPDTTNWDTSKVTTMQQMFQGATSANPDTTNWDTSKVTTMQYMFSGATSANPDTSNWDTSQVTNMRYMFYGATSANPDTTNWDTHNVTDMSYMFDGATSFNQDISSWNTSSVTTMKEMFDGATSFNQDIGDWDVHNVTDMTLMFDGVTLSTTNYDNILIGWAGQSPNLKDNVLFSGGNSKYCLGTSARNDTLIGTHSWTITDGGVSENCDLEDPYFTTIPANATLELNVTGLGVDFEADDAIGFDSYSVNDTTNFEINSSGYLQNITTLTLGTYLLNITINDSSNNLNSTLYSVFVNDTLAPYFIDLTNVSILNNETLGIDLNATDLGLGIADWSINWTTNFTINNSGYLENSSVLIVGDYYINVSVNDSLGNTNSTIIYIQVNNSDIIPPQVTISSPTATTYASPSVSVDIRLNEEGYCEYSLNSGTSNTSLTAETGNLRFISTLTGLANGNYVLWAYCNDTAGNRNDTQNVSFTVNVATPVIETPSGGGGGGAGVVQNIEDLVVLPNSIEANVLKNVEETRTFKITNKGDKAATLSFSVSGGDLNNVLSVISEPVVLDAGETKDIAVKINAVEKGLLTGKIVVKSGTSIYEIPVVINVRTDNFLFDVCISVFDEFKKLSNPKILRTQVDLLEVGVEDEKVDVTAEYVIKDFEGHIYLQESETFFVLGDKSYTKEFDISKLESGRYLVGLEIVYPGAFATSSAQFEVTASSTDKLEFVSGIIGILIVFALIGFSAFKFVKRK
jgi:surface protein